MAKDATAIPGTSDKAAWSILNRYHCDLADKIVETINAGDDQEEREIMSGLIQGAARYAALPSESEGT